ncbi:MAG: zinc-finger domain-containing protein [Nitrosospira sp.]|nr:zinc-finger domain-containing protein [Nitrosospira sp.]MDW7643317.1 zinc-finger domain-containing protein [Nitrosomonadaceae bacterium]MBI0407140.1 zinc-finger domain-containing protein [Nitrosospira sp.]MBI0414097.1 zinc-finger domain-containing protein [Nitrosospira sp.]MBI0416317.1 zinc-finger domain-containing protein [Nitrosospira sp.]
MQNSLIPKKQNSIEITIRDLPLHCPTSLMSAWDSHPRVFLPIKDMSGVSCPYCGTHYILRNLIAK